jgi:putative N6-adenine-specific DNA methylase
MRCTFFAACAPGLEPVLHAELHELGMARIERQVGGVRFAGELADAWRANLWLRTAARVLLRLAQFPAADADQLYAGVVSVDWRTFVRPEGTLSVVAQVRDSGLTHSGFVAQRCKDAIVDQLRARFGVRPSVDRADPELRVHVHVYRDRATLSVDTSGPALHRRGWRRHQGTAPLAETLAAAIVLHSGWDRRAPLLDPFCGTGTVLIEAALLAANAPPGALRGFAFERWPGHDADAWRRCKASASAAATHPAKLRLIGSDLDAERIAEARDNAASAGCDGRIELDVRDARGFAPRAGWNGWVVTNLPFGERIGDVRALEPMLREFGGALRACTGFHFALLSGAERLTRALDLPRARRIAILHGGIPTELCVGRIGE